MSDQNEASVIQKAWQYFCERIKTDEDAAELFFTWYKRRGGKCKCKKPDYSTRKYGERFFKCPKCNRKVYFTSGTLLSGATRLRAWAAAIWFKELKIPISALTLSQLTGVAQSTGLNIHRKINMVINSEIDDTALEVDAQLFADVIIRRCTGSYAKAHPRDEVAYEGDAEGTKTRRNIDFSSLAAGVLKLSTQALRFIHNRFQGVSARCIQLYLATLWSIVDTEKWPPGSILDACLSHRAITYQEVLTFQSGLNLRMMPRPNIT